MIIIDLLFGMFVTSSLSCVSEGANTKTVQNNKRTRPRSGDQHDDSCIAKSGRNKRTIMDDDIGQSGDASQVARLSRTSSSHSVCLSLSLSLSFSLARVHIRIKNLKLSTEKPT